MSLANLPGIRQFDLTGRTALVTGGSMGLGAAIGAGLASAGAQVALLARNGDQARSAAAEIQQAFAAECIGVAADVTESEGLVAACAQVTSELGPIDILVNSAGINIRGSIDELTHEDFRAVQKVNVDGTWLACRTVLPGMKERGYGRIINLASTLGVVGLANRTPYTSSKGAVVQMTRALGLELANHGITCNAICPGPFLTPMNEPIAETEEAKKFIIGAVAQNRWGELKEIQGAAILLASDASSFMTGSLLTVDGGWTAR